jgi:SAM-dependent methyltransferase
MFEPYVCPACRAPLRQSRESIHDLNLICSSCYEEFRVSLGIPILIPREAWKRLPVQKVKDVYDRAYQHPGIMGTQFDPEYSRLTKTTLLTFCQNAPNQHILDIGTGDGDLGEFVPSDWNWHGIDISEVGIRRAATRFPTLSAAVAVSEWLPYPDGYFGAVVAVDSIEHAFDLSQSLRSIKRVLVPHGIFALSVPTPNSLLKWGYNRIFRGAPSVKLIFRLIKVVLKRTFLFGHPTFQPIDRDLTLENWSTTLQEAGFRIVAVQEWPCPPFKPIVYLLSAQVRQ